jgi:WD40 repeat protein
VATRAALGQPIKPFGYKSPVWSLACSPDSKTVAAGGDSVLTFWDLATHKQLGSPITAQKDRIWSLAFSPNGESLAAAGNSLVVEIWKTGHGNQLIRKLGAPAKGDDFEVMPVGLSFTPDGKLLATSTQKHSVTIWNPESGQPLPPLLYGHTQAVSSVAFRHDGKLLASGSADDDIRLWDADTHELVGTLAAQQTAVNGIVFAPDKGTLASVGEDNSIIFWNLDFDSWTSRACQIANRNLTLEEWNTYLGTSRYRKTCPNL